MSEQIIWKEPPPANVGRPSHPACARIPEFVEALKGRPDTWALFGQHLPESLGGKLREHPGVKVTRRTCGKGSREYDIYAKWVDEEVSSE